MFFDFRRTGNKYIKATERATEKKAHTRQDVVSIESTMYSSNVHIYRKSPPVFLL